MKDKDGAAQPSPSATGGRPPRQPRLARIERHDDLDLDLAGGDEPLPVLGGDQSMTGPIRAVSLNAGLSLADHPGVSATRAIPIDELPTWILPAITPTVITAPTSTRLQAVVKGTESYVTLLRNLARSSGIYAIASIVSPMVSLLLAPFLTRYMTLEEYGALAVLNTLISLMAGVTQLGLASAFFRAYSYDFTSPSGKRSVIATVAVLLMLVSSVVVSLAALNARSISQILFQTGAFTTAVVIAIGAMLMQNLTVPGFAWLRAENKPVWFSALSISNLGVSLGANIVLVGVLHLGLNGSLLATMSGYFVVALLTLPFLIIHSRLLLRPEVARSMLAFGVPMVLSVVSFWILQLSDRYLLGLLATLSVTASYALAYNLGGVLNTLILAPFMLAWPSALFRIAKRDDAAAIYRIIFRWMTTLLLLAAFGFSIAGRMALIWFFPPSYHDAVMIVPIIAGSLVFYGAYLFFMTGASITRKTWLATVFTSAAAALNVGLNLVLIPQFQAFGAAASTLIAYIVMAALAYVVNQRIYPVPFELARFIIAYLLGVAIYLGVFLLAGAVAERFNLAISLAGLAAYACCLFLLIPRPTFLRRVGSPSASDHLAQSAFSRQEQSEHMQREYR